jgi:WD40 repeat protein
MAEMTLNHMWDTNRDKEWYRYLYLIASAELELRSEKPEQAAKLLDECPLSYRHFEWSFARRRCARPVFHLQLPGRIHGLAFSPDGRHFVTAGDVDSLGELRVWDYPSGDCVQTIEEQNGSFRSAAYSPNGKYVAAGLMLSTMDELACDVCVWDALKFRQIWRFHGTRGWAHHVVFSPCGRTLAVADWDGDVRFWDIEKGTKTLEFDGHSSTAFGISFSPDGSYLASAGGCPGHEGQTIIWDTATGERIRSKWCKGNAVGSVAYSPDGRRIASPCGSDVIIWDPATGKDLLRLSGHSDYVGTAIWHPDGQRLVSTSADESVKIWDAVSGDVVLTFRPIPRCACAAAFNAQRSALAMCQGDGIVEIWDGTPIEDQPGQMRFA